MPFDPATNPVLQDQVTTLAPCLQIQMTHQRKPDPPYDPQYAAAGPRLGSAEGAYSQAVEERASASI